MVENGGAVFLATSRDSMSSRIEIQYWISQRCEGYQNDMRF